MWKLCDLLSAEIGPKLCETRLQDGQLAMCINPDAQYGHGHGPLWAVENQCVQFSTQRSLGYVEGVLDGVKQHGRSNDNHPGRLDGNECRWLLVH